MANEKGERVTVAISKEIHKQHSHIASLLGKDLREATDEAVTEWNNRNASTAKKKANQLLQPS